MTDTKPFRVQLRRVLGWRMPPNTVKVSRPARWGNPFALGTHLVLTDDTPSGWRPATRTECVEAYRGTAMVSPEFRDEIRRELRGKNLACWCPLDAPCHADVLLEIANG